MRVLLDTTALYVAAGLSGKAFTPKVQSLIEDSATVLLVSPISFTEVAIKANKELTALTREQLVRLVFDLDLTVLPLTDVHALKLFGLPTHHHDPFDRMLIATALAEDVPLLASDHVFKKYKGLHVIW